MTKVKNWVGILALTFLIIQSSIGILNYTQSNQGDFPSRMDRISRSEEGGFPGNPPQMNNQDATNSQANSDTANGERDNSNSANREDSERPENSQMPNFNEQPSREEGAFTHILRNADSGTPGFTINIISLTLALIWLILTFLLRRKNKNNVDEVA